jgi:hypothetical protein
MKPRVVFRMHVREDATERKVFHGYRFRTAAKPSLSSELYSLSLRCVWALLRGQNGGSSEMHPLSLGHSNSALTQVVGMVH